MKNELHQLTLFSEFSDEQLEYLITHSQVKIYQAGQAIHEGEPSSYFGFYCQVRGTTHARFRVARKLSRSNEIRLKHGLGALTL